jgi:beta-lactam-binding protein with PASTA domain
MGFAVAIEDGQQSSSLPPGTVIGQDTQAAAPEPRGSVVTIAVIGDAHAIVVPEYSGLTLAQVRLRFAAVGLHVTATRSVGGKALASDLVVDANVRAGTQQVPAGSTVTVQTSPPGR